MAEVTMPLWLMIIFCVLAIIGFLGGVTDVSATELSSVLWGNIVGVPDVVEVWDIDGVWLVNDSNVLVFNESLLNATIDDRDDVGNGSGGVDTKWGIDSVSLINVSDILMVNQTWLNATIDDRDDVGGGGGDVDDVWVNETGDSMSGVLNMSVDVEIAWSSGFDIKQNSAGDVIFHAGN